MSKVSRRDLLKTGLLAPAAIAVANGMGPVGIAMQELAQHPGSAFDGAGTLAIATHEVDGRHAEHDPEQQRDHHLYEK